MSDPFVGKLTYFRVYSGKVKAGDRVLNMSTGKTERVSRLLQMHANHREEREEIGAGEIVAAVGLKHTTTGDTLAIESAPISARVDGVPGPGHLRRDRAEDEGRPGQARPGPRAAGGGGSDLPRPHATRRPARRSSPAWASSTSRSSSTASCASSRSTRTSAARRSPTARRSASRSRRSRASSCGRPADAASTATPSSPASRPSRARATSSSTGSSAARSRKEYIPSVDMGIQEAMESGILAGYPVVDVRDRAHRRLVPRRRLERDGVQDRRLHGVQGAPCSGRSRSCSSR